MANIDEGKRVLTVRETSILLRCSRGATYNAIRKGLIPSLRLGKKILIPRAALEKLLDGVRDGDKS